MATSLTTVTGRLLDPAGQPVVNEYVYFYLRQAGADNDITLLENSLLTITERAN